MISRSFDRPGTDLLKSDGFLFERRREMGKVVTFNCPDCPPGTGTTTTARFSELKLSGEIFVAVTISCAKCREPVAMANKWLALEPVPKMAARC